MIADLIPTQIFAFMLILARISGVVMLMPGFGELNIPAWIKVAFSVAVSVVLLPLVSPVLPPFPSTPAGVVVLTVNEALIGLLIGALTRLLLNALHVGGTVIAFQTGLAAAQGFDANQHSQSAMFATFMTLLGVNLIFASNLHHLLVQAMADSYMIFSPGKVPPLGQISELSIAVVRHSFEIGVKLAAPFLAFGIVFNVGLGLVARLMPTLQVFFIAVPAQILLGFALFAFVLTSMMFWFLDYFRSGLAPLLTSQ